MKQKVLVIITNYGNSQFNCLKRILQEYNKFKKYKLKVILANTEYIKDLNYPNLEIQQELFDPSVKLWLTHKHKKIMYENKDNYDIFIYSENDMLITEKHLDLFLKHSKNLEGTNYIPGFLRYELKKNDSTKYIIDCHPIHAVNQFKLYTPIKTFNDKLANNSKTNPQKRRLRVYSIVRPLINFIPQSIKNKLRFSLTIQKANIELNGEKYFQVHNKHQASYILTKEQFKKVLESGNYLNEKYNYGGGVIEGAASNIFVICGLNKVISKKDFEASLIHHVANKYVDDHIVFTTDPAPTTKELLELINFKK